ncbi:MAG TPA: glutathione S-transferase family protein, partial [Ramlibacter sp.]|nr:glutathione S-transferase family protein [Ramlibacter sp.]
MNAELTLISHPLCPYVQRAAIVLAEKNAAFTRRYVDLAAKPDWFLAISPLGKTPVLLAQDEPLFESAVICEYLDETIAPKLHPEGALERARHRGWMEFGSAVLNTIAGFYGAPDARTLQARRAELHARFAQIENALSG